MASFCYDLLFFAPVPLQQVEFCMMVPAEKLLYGSSTWNCAENRAEHTEYFL